MSDGMQKCSLPRHEFAYLILAHGKLDQLLRLVRTIRAGSPKAAILLHQDAKSDLPDEITLQRLNVHLVFPRISAVWGNFSLVEAVLNSITYTSRTIDFDWLMLISGQDYPLRPFPLIENELRNSLCDAFVKASPVSKGPYSFRYYMQYWQLPKMRYAHRLPQSMHKLLWWSREYLNRLNIWIRVQPGPRNTPSLLGIRALNYPFSDTFVCHKGSQWFTLSERATKYLVEYGQQRPDVLSHYRRTLIPDESYFQTVLCNSDCLQVCDDHRHFIVWEAATSHPKTLTIHDLDVMVQSGKDWGRKFDTTVDSTVLDALDRIVLG